MMNKVERAKQIYKAMQFQSGALPDEQAAQVPAVFPAWDASGAYTADERVQYGDVLYKCLTGHTAQESWAPDVSPSLWVRVDNPAEEWPQWRQPQGSTDAYELGAKVSHNGKRWTSTVDNNVWEPGVYGWSEVV
ncbi:MAG: carbohydrate-binding protein [Oscillospiraceae bacterium]